MIGSQSSEWLSEKRLKYPDIFTPILAVQKYESGGVILSAKRVTFSPDFLHPLEMDLSWFGGGVRGRVRQNGATSLNIKIGGKIFVAVRGQ